jgi:hypothetical protein
MATPMSQIEMLARTGSPPGDPVDAIMPTNACMMAS